MWIYFLCFRTIWLPFYMFATSKFKSHRNVRISRIFVFFPFGLLFLLLKRMSCETWLRPPSSLLTESFVFFCFLETYINNVDEKVLTRCLGKNVRNARLQRLKGKYMKMLTRWAINSSYWYNNILPTGRGSSHAIKTILCFLVLRQVNKVRMNFSLTKLLQSELPKIEPPKASPNCSHLLSERR